MAWRKALRQMESSLGVVVVVTVLPASAQQDVRRQGSQNQHLVPSPSPLQSSSSRLRQEPLPLGRQPDLEGHPQVKEMPPAQSPTAVVPQSESVTPQSAVNAPQSGPSAAQPDPLPPVTPAIPPLAAHPAKPPYFGIRGESVPGCRCPAGIRVTHVVQNSPAHRAGLKGERSLTWTQAAETTL